MSLLQLFKGREPADGASPALEALADASSFPPSQPVGNGRRERDIDGGEAVVQDALGVKLMHGWLQNRHQTLMPLTFNVGNLSTSRREALARMLATFLLVGRPAPDATDFAPTLRTWLSGVGGDVDTLIAFDAAFAAPLPLNRAFDDAHELDLSIYAYVAALVASDTRFPVSVMLCDMIQARFDLPTAIVLSAVRRYRR